MKPVPAFFVHFVWGIAWLAPVRVSFEGTHDTIPTVLAKQQSMGDSTLFSGCKHHQGFSEDFYLHRRLPMAWGKLVCGGREGQSKSASTTTREHL